MCKVVLTYVCVGLCVCVCVGLKSKYQRSVCPMTECVCIYVVDDVEVNEKFSILNGGKYTNFIRTINVVFAGCKFSHFRLLS